MRKNNKRGLYESIMRNVSRIVKKTLNETDYPSSVINNNKWNTSISNDIDDIDDMYNEINSDDLLNLIELDFNELMDNLSNIQIADIQIIEETICKLLNKYDNSEIEKNIIMYGANEVVDTIFSNNYSEIVKNTNKDYKEYVKYFDKLFNNIDELDNYKDYIRLSKLCKGFSNLAIIIKNNPEINRNKQITNQLYNKLIIKMLRDNAQNLYKYVQIHIPVFLKSSNNDILAFNILPYMILLAVLNQFI